MLVSTAHSSVAFGNREFHAVLSMVDEQPCAIRELYADLIFAMAPGGRNDLSFQQVSRLLSFILKL